MLHLAGTVARLLTAPLKLPAEIGFGRRERRALFPLRLSSGHNNSPVAHTWNTSSVGTHSVTLVVAAFFTVLFW